MKSSGSTSALSLIALLLLVRLAWLAAGKIELSEDEAYQWIWSKHLALSYYSKPLLIACVQFLGTHLWGDNEFGVRFFSPVISAALSLLLLRFMAREVNSRTAFFVVAVLNVTPLMALGSLLMTIDPLSVLVLDGGDGGGLARRPAGRLNAAMALGGTLDGPGIAGQIHQPVPVDLLGCVFRGLAARAGASPAARALAGAADRGGLPAAHRDLERPARLDHD